MAVAVCPTQMLNSVLFLIFYFCVLGNLISQQYQSYFDAWQDSDIDFFIVANSIEDGKKKIEQIYNRLEQIIPKSAIFDRDGNVTEEKGDKVGKKKLIKPEPKLKPKIQPEPYQKISTSTLPKDLAWFSSSVIDP